MKPASPLPLPHRQLKQEGGSFPVPRVVGLVEHLDHGVVQELRAADLDPRLSDTHEKHNTSNNEVRQRLTQVSKAAALSLKTCVLFVSVSLESHAPVCIERRRRPTEPAYQQPQNGA